MEDNSGAKGVIETLEPNKLLSMRYYDDIDAPDGSPLGDYQETIRLEPLPDGNVRLTASAGPLPKKYLAAHSSSWEASFETIRRLAES